MKHAYIYTHANIDIHKCIVYMYTISIKNIHTKRDKTGRTCKNTCIHTNITTLKLDNIKQSNTYSQFLGMFDITMGSGL